MLSCFITLLLCQLILCINHRNEPTKTITKVSHEIVPLAAIPHASPPQNSIAIALIINMLSSPFSWGFLLREFLPLNIIFQVKIYLILLCTFYVYKSYAQHHNKKSFSIALNSNANFLFSVIVLLANGLVIVISPLSSMQTLKLGVWSFHIPPKSLLFLFCESFTFIPPKLFLAIGGSDGSETPLPLGGSDRCGQRKKNNEDGRNNNLLGGRPIVAVLPHNLPLSYLHGKSSVVPWGTLRSQN